MPLAGHFGPRLNAHFADNPLRLQYLTILIKINIMSALSQFTPEFDDSRVAGPLPQLSVFQPVPPCLSACATEMNATSPPAQPKTPSATTPPSAALLAEMAAASDQLEQATPTEIIAWASERFAPKLTMATAFGPEGMTIIHMLSQVAPATRVFNLDTGYQFPETLAMVDRIRDRYGIDVKFERPELTVEQFEQQNGGPIYKTDPSQCCFQRKLVVLHRAIVGYDAWISAIRRDQSPDRAKAPIVGWDKKFGLVKVNPLANSTKQDVWKMITDEDVPYNPLHDKGYTSIGCAPCTRSVAIGEDERAGRWSGTAKTECGLHSLDD
jgi:phosphoadenosine phosphosulfate reductase